MKHMIRDAEMEKGIGNGMYTVFSCIHDDGKKSTYADVLMLGDGDALIVFFPCDSCKRQIQAQILQPIMVEAAKEAIKSGYLNYNLNYNDFRRFDSSMSASEAEKK